MNYNWVRTYPGHDMDWVTYHPLEDIHVSTFTAYYSVVSAQSDLFNINILK